MGGGMMGGRKADLKHAPPEGQVTKLSHCGDTYTVSTADGKVEKAWEFNLLLNTDASHQGPPEGKPVIVGAGMRGDRSSVVFAKPSEISTFIGTECHDEKK
jgi:cytochrome c